MKDTGGGWAFPAQHFDLADGEHGMTLRDYFAAKAMQAIVGAEREPSPAKVGGVAEQAYILADAMIQERSKE
jgi:hypothetical protein